MGNLLYDCETDGHLDYGDILYINADGSRELVRKKQKAVKVKDDRNGEPGNGIDFSKVKPTGQLVLLE